MISDGRIQYDETKTKRMSRRDLSQRLRRWTTAYGASPSASPACQGATRLGSSSEHRKARSARDSSRTSDAGTGGKRRCSSRWPPRWRRPSSSRKKRQPPAKPNGPADQDSPSTRTDPAWRMERPATRSPGRTGSAGRPQCPPGLGAGSVRRRMPSHHQGPPGGSLQEPHGRDGHDLHRCAGGHLEDDLRRAGTRAEVRPASQEPHRHPTSEGA